MLTAPANRVWQGQTGNDSKSFQIKEIEIEHMSQSEKNWKTMRNQ